MTQRNCPVCGSKESHIVDEINLVNFDNEQNIFDRQTIKACDQCGFVYHTMNFDGFDSHYMHYTGNSTIKPMTDDEKILNNNMEDFIQYHLNIPKDAKILDVGCGYGWLLGLFKERGYTDVYGMDTDKDTIEKLKLNGLKVSYGNICLENGEVVNLNEKYDVIVSKMVFEHLLNPRLAVENIAKYLNDGGILVIEVPDVSLYDTTAFFPGYFQSVNMEHINNYSYQSLCNLLYDFRAIASESTPSGGIFPVLRVAFKKQKQGIPSDIVFCSTDEKKIRYSIHKFSAYGKRMNEKIQYLLNGKKKCVVWGVSAFTKGLLTYTDLRHCNIDFFVDSNPLYQTKTLLGRAIMAPSVLKNCAATIVIPGKTSQKSILKAIQDMDISNEIVCLSE